MRGERISMSEAIISRRGGSTRSIVDLNGITALPSHVLNGYRYIARNGVLTNGTMTNRGSLSRNINVGDSYTYYSGYYTGGTINAIDNRPKELRTEYIAVSQSYVVPYHTGPISVRIFGGGGGGTDVGGSRSEVGGGGGWMNNGDLTIANGETVQITIGTGGRSSESRPTAGGSIFFGSYLSANGGSSASGSYGGDGGSGGGGDAATVGGRGYQFGGGGGMNGGDGGTWGGGGGGRNGGNGGIYGGGGGAGPNCNGFGTGGTYGGNGGRGGRNSTEEAGESGEMGTNTMSNSSVDANCRGTGAGGMGTEGRYEKGGCGGGGGGSEAVGHAAENGLSLCPGILL